MTTKPFILSLLAISILGLTACSSTRNDRLENRLDRQDERSADRAERMQMRSDAADERFNRSFDAM